MFFLNLAACCAADTAYTSGYLKEPVTSVQVTYGIIDDLYVSEAPNPKFELEDENKWSDYTDMHAKFDNTEGNGLVAGNMDFDTYGVDTLRLKRRRVGDYLWNTIYEKHLTELEDFSVNFDDFYACCGTWYEYAMVSVDSLQDVENEKAYITTKVYSDFDGIGIADKHHMYYTRLNCISSSNINAPGAIVNTLGRKYPFVIHNGENEYFTGTVEGVFVEVDKEKREGKFDHIYLFNQDFKRFLVNGKPKVIKDMFGQRWAVSIAENPQAEMDSHHYNLKTSISWVEIGDIEDDRTMKALGLI